MKRIHNLLLNSSIEELSKIEEQISQIKKDLEKNQPSYDTAIMAGIKDETYSTNNYGEILSYSGKTLWQNPETKELWIFIGHRPTGSPDTLKEEGYIEMININFKAINLEKYVSYPRNQAGGTGNISFEWNNNEGLNLDILSKSYGCNYNHPRFNEELFFNDYPKLEGLLNINKEFIDN